MEAGKRTFQVTSLPTITFFILFDLESVNRILSQIYCQMFVTRTIIKTFSKLSLSCTFHQKDRHMLQLEEIRYYIVALLQIVPAAVILNVQSIFGYTGASVFLPCSIRK